jgi:hypothetical protein
MNIVDFEKNALYRVLELVRTEARRWGVPVLETEVYGMIPAAALLGSASYYMQIADFDPKQVIELRLLQMLGFRPGRSSGWKTPGGGAAFQARSPLLPGWVGGSHWRRRGGVGGTFAP